MSLKSIKPIGLEYYIFIGKEDTLSDSLGGLDFIGEHTIIACSKDSGIICILDTRSPERESRFNTANKMDLSLWTGKMISSCDGDSNKYCMLNSQGYILIYDQRQFENPQHKYKLEVPNVTNIHNLQFQVKACDSVIHN